MFWGYFIVTKQPSTHACERVLVAVVVLQCSGLQWDTLPTNAIPNCTLEGFTVDTKHPKRYTPTEAAGVIGISPNSLRNWCATFKEHLSEGATPAPGIDRILTDKDVGILQRVKEMRAEHRTYEFIKNELATMPVETDLAPYIDATIEPATSPEPLQAPTVATLPLELVQALQSLADDRYSALQQQIDAIGAAQSNRMVWFMFGLLAGLLLAIVGIVVVWLGLMVR